MTSLLIDVRAKAVLDVIVDNYLDFRQISGLEVYEPAKRADTFEAMRPFSLLLMLAVPLGAASVQNPLDKVLDPLFAVRHFREVAISPDGKKVAWVEASHSKIPAEARFSTVYIDGRRISADRCAAHSLAWSHDGRLAFLSDAGSKGQLQLWMAAGAAPAKKLTTVKGYLDDPHWSPDGRTIAVLFTEGAPKEATGPLEATAAETGVIDQKVTEQRLTLVDAQSGRMHAVSPADLYVYEHDWSPDGGKIVYSAAPGPGDDNWFIAKLYTIDLKTGEARQIFDPAGLQLAQPRWSPDGKSIAFIQGLMSDEGFTGGEIYVVSRDGGPAKNLTPGRKSSPSWIQWLPSSNRILFAEHVAGEAGFATLDLASGETERLWKGPESVEPSFSDDGTQSAVIRTSWSMAPEIWAGPVGKWKQITSVNGAMKATWGEAESVAWQNDGFQVQGWLVKPVRYDAQRHYPMIVSVHGGPAGESMPRWPSPFFDLSVLSSEDYFVFFPNPRGSYGQGEEFTKANVKDFGGGDLRDILSGVDAVLKRYPVDPERIGIGGWSYGGYMTMWAVTQTNRFHAAVSGAGLANWQSYYGENSIDQWMIPYFGASVYDDPAVYAKSAPIDFIKRVKTPTLVVVGERDGECPAPQSYEFWHALKTLGVKTQLVVYPNEGHRFVNPEHILDVMQRTVAWFNDNLGNRPE
jgi:dipeptidyl aminopeptidase/acylaminoacyl peptidase